MATWGMLGQGEFQFSLLQENPGTLTLGFPPLGLSPFNSATVHWIVTCRILEDLHKGPGGLKRLALRQGNKVAVSTRASEQQTQD